MEHGGNPELKNRFGQRVIDIVIEAGGDHLIPRVESIVDSGVDINSQEATVVRPSSMRFV